MADPTDQPGAESLATASVTRGRSGLERVTVNLSARSVRALEATVALTGETKTDVINRAIQLYAFAEQITAQGGAVYARETSVGDIERLRFF